MMDISDTVLGQLLETQRKAHHSNKLKWNRLQMASCGELEVELSCAYSGSYPTSLSMTTTAHQWPL
jgi:hypothetical protein